MKNKKKNLKKLHKNIDKIKTVSEGIQRDLRLNIDHRNDIDYRLTDIKTNYEVNKNDIASLNKKLDNYQLFCVLSFFLTCLLGAIILLK
jgi:hypothetical protein